jgi:hypothetical protein
LLLQIGNYPFFDICHFPCVSCLSGARSSWFLNFWGGFYFPNIHKRFYLPFSSTSFLQVSPSTFFELLIIDFIGRHDTNRFNW